MTTDNNLIDAQNELFELLAMLTTDEVFEFRGKVIDGKIANVYFIWDYGCLYGTAALIRGVEVFLGEDEYTINDVFETDLLNPYVITPLEYYAINIQLGETPNNNPYARQILDWVDEYLSQELLPTNEETETEEE